MATIWWYSGPDSQHGLPLGDLPWQRCVELLDIDFARMVADPPKFLKEQVLVQANAAEMILHSLPTTYFVSSLPATEARQRFDSHR